jgi:predicted transcriptional regulator
VAGVTKAVRREALVAVIETLSVNAKRQANSKREGKQALSPAGQAEKSSVSREYIARLETGHHDPSLSTLMKLAKALKVKVEELLD